MPRAGADPAIQSRRRKLAAFCRLLCLYRSRDVLVREGIDRMAATLGDPSQTAAEREELMDRLEEWLFDEPEP